MFIDLPQTTSAVELGHDDWHAPVLQNQEWFYCDVTRQFVGNFAVGDIVYRPTRRLAAVFEPPAPQTNGRFSVTGLTRIAGCGKSIDDARSDWELKIDAEIQRLLGLQDFELTDADKDSQSELAQFFDFSEIRYSVPLQIQNHGKLISVFPRPWKVQWIDGTTSEVSRHQVPAELIRFSVGQEFDAVVEQDPRNGSLVKILSVFRAQSPRVLDSEVEDLLSQARSSSELPDLDWD